MFISLHQLQISPHFWVILICISNFPFWTKSSRSLSRPTVKSYILIRSLLSCKLLLDILDRPYRPFNMKRIITSTDKMTTKSCVNYSEKIYKNSKSSVSFKVETCHNRDWSEHFELIHDLQGSLLHTEAKTHVVMKTQTNFAHRAESSYPDIWFGV